MMQGVTIRPARPADLTQIARFIYLNMRIEADWLFSQQKGHPTLQVQVDLYRHKNNRLSRIHTHLAKQDGQTPPPIMEA